VSAPYGVDTGILYGSFSVMAHGPLPLTTPSKGRVAYVFYADHEAQTEWREAHHAGHPVDEYTGSINVQ
jgi:hypothetical protein